MGFNEKVPHYQIAGVEVISIIEEALEGWGLYLYEEGYSPDEIAKFSGNMFNVLKYALRAHKKGQFSSIKKMVDYGERILNSD